MAEPFSVLKIESEERAWEFLEQALGAGIPPDVVPVIDFEGWPTITIYLPETPVEGSISPTMMEALLELQKTIYRTHTFLTADTGDLRSLSQSEKDALEFRVKVEKGSSGYEINLTDILSRLGTEALTKMEPIHIVITILGIALIIGGTYAFKLFLNNKTELRKLEVDDVDKRAWLEAQQANYSQDTRRLEILAQAMVREPILQEVEASADSAKQQLIKAVGEERGGSVSGVEVPSDLAAEIVTQRRRQSETVALSGYYRVDRVDTTTPDGFRVTLSDLSSGQTVTASMLDILVSEDDRQVIRDAEWNKKPVYVELNAKVLRKRFVDAVVLAARTATETDLQHLRAE